ncbi:hypothetical protein [Paraburkholderia sp. XV]|uniref:hypothetical protein n=1 Tax=Paraburkholderia sp. XV TaxID=2831520 RepID=UPI001CD8022D|nr:hypothetical protein [Paraburkholderia sp. XV]
MDEPGLAAEKPTGLEDVVRSVRTLARDARHLGESAALVLERELAMAVSISEKLRDSTISAEALKRGRDEPLPGALRRDMHRAVDLVADVGSVAYTTLVRMIEGFVDEPRPPLAVPEQLKPAED